MHTAWVTHTMVQVGEKFFPPVYFLTFKIFTKFLYYYQRLSQEVMRELPLSLKAETKFLVNLS